MRIRNMLLHNPSVTAYAVPLFHGRIATGNPVDFMGFALALYTREALVHRPNGVVLLSGFILFLVSNNNLPGS